MLPLSSRLAYAEVHAALAAAHRNHDLTPGDLDRATASFDGYWVCLRPVELTVEVQRIAGRVAGTHALRGADAVHLASALVIGDPDLVMAVWDQRLASGSLAAGIAVSPAARPTA